MEYRSVKASSLSRLGSAIIDLMVAMLLFVFALNFVFSPIISSTSSYQSTYDNYVEELTSTGLFSVEESGKLTSNLNSFSIDNDKEYYQTLINFYEENNFISEEQTFIARIDESGFYDGDKLKSDVDENKLYAFYEDENDIAIDILLENNASFNETFKQMRIYHYLLLILSIEVALIITYLLFPLIFKNGQTLGKRIFNLKVVSSKDITVTPKKYIILLRELIFITLSFEIPILIYSLSALTFNYFNLPLVIYLIPLVMELIYILVSPSNNSIHDAIVKTAVIDSRKEEEYKENEQMPV